MLYVIPLSDINSSMSLSFKDEQSLFPKRMFVFSFNEWAYKKAEPYIIPVLDSKPVKWWKDRKKRQAEKQRSKRKSVFD